jgi:hypothetical protein
MVDYCAAIGLNFSEKFILKAKIIGLYAVRRPVLGCQRAACNFSNKKTPIPRPSCPSS